MGTRIQTRPDTRLAARRDSRAPRTWPAITARLRRADLVVLLVFVGFAALLFRLALFEGWTFIGDSDRINDLLSVRLFEVFSIQQRGFVPAWSDQQFMGFGTAGLHWMLPGVSPFPYLMALFPLTEMVRVANVITIGLFVVASWLAYLALRTYSAGPLPAAVGALLYSTSSYAILRLAQIDASFSVLAIVPLVLVGIRETRRTTVLIAYPVLTACWAALTLFTFLQEVGYVALFFGAYTVYRSLRLRDPWPLVVSGLAFATGVTIGLPRLITVAVDFQELARSSTNFQWVVGEALRFFGDGLLGRTLAEQALVRGRFVNLHEGLQVLHSALGALAVIAAALFARSWVMRLWGALLVTVLSVVLVIWGRSFYDGLGNPTFLSRELRVVLVNAVLIGLPLWLLSSWLVTRRRRVRTGAAPPRGVTLDDVEDRPAALVDGPFFVGFVVLALATILISEAHVALYNLFLRVDFQHARISSVMLLPLGALATIFLSRFLPVRLDRRTLRYLAGGLVVGLLLWLVREGVAVAAVAAAGPVLEAFRPRRLLTVEVVRVGTSLLVLLAALVLLVRRRSSSRRSLALTGASGVLIVFMLFETGVSADFKLSGPQTREQAFPFESFNALNVPPGQFRVPSLAERAALEDRLEANRYRAVLLEDPGQFVAHVEPHLSAFWGLRLIEGYGAGLPRRIEMLPFGERMLSPHDLNLNSSHSMPWRLLAALNVKYVVLVDRAFWFNTGTGGADPPFDPARLQVIENPSPVTPRVFFTARVSPAGEQPLLPGDDGVRPAPADPDVEEPAQHSVVEGIPAERRFATDGLITPSFEDDRVVVRVEASSEDRFLVLNELYHSSWQAWVDDRPATIYPTNLVMRGIVVPAGTTTVELRYMPFLLSWYGLGLLAGGLLASALVWWGLRSYLDRRTANERSVPARPWNVSAPGEPERQRDPRAASLRA